MFISKTGSKYCPVANILNFLKNAGLNREKDSEAFLIPTLFKTKKGHIASKTRGISYTRVNEIFHENIKMCINDDKNYGYTV